jgi:hypothetical protein
VQRLLAKFEAHDPSAGPLDVSYEPDVHVITGGLKLFLRSLPEPLVPYEHYAGVVTAGRTGTTGAKDGLEELSRVRFVGPHAHPPSYPPH